MTMSARLIVCKRERDLRLVPADGRNVVASNDPLVVRRATSHPNVAESRFLEGMLTLPRVWTRVMELTRTLNAWMLQDKPPHMPDSVIAWPLWAEGGDTTQRLVDIALLIESYTALLGPGFDEVIVPLTLSDLMEDSVLLAVCRQKGVPVTTHGGGALRRRLRLRRKTVRIGRRGLTIGVPQRLLDFAKWAALQWRLHRTHDPVVCSSDVMILLASPFKKHFDNADVLVDGFARRGLVPLVVCWKSRSGFDFFEGETDVVELEAWYPHQEKRDLELTYRILRDHLMKRAQHEPVALDYNGIDIFDLIRPWLRKYVDFELRERMTAFACLTAFFKRNRFDLCRTWGSGIAPVGAMMFDVLQAQPVPRPFVFQNVVGTEVYAFQRESTRACDLVLVPGRHDIDMALESGVDVSNMHVGGFPRDTLLAAFREEHDSAASRAALGLRRQAALRLFYISGGITRGFVSPAEHYRVAEALLALARDAGALEIIVKPHPAEDQGRWHRLLAGAPPNVKLIDQQASPWHCVNAADVVLTKFSTLAFEAMEFGKPVISISLDGDPLSQRMFGNSAEKVDDLDALRRLILSLLDAEAFRSWREKIVARQTDFLPNKFFKPDGDVGDYIVHRVLTARESWLAADAVLGTDNDLD